MLRELRFTAELEKPMTVRDFLRGEKGVSQRLLARLKQTPGGIARNGAPATAADLLENGDVVVGVWLANGTSSDVSYSSISLSLTDENQVLSGSCAMSVTVPAGTGKMVFVRVPAASVYTGTATWSSLTGTVTVS